MNAQAEFNFEAGAEGEGYSRWLAERKVAAIELARRLNLPLQHEVEVRPRASSLCEFRGILPK